MNTTGMLQFGDDAESDDDDDEESGGFPLTGGLLLCQPVQGAATADPSTESTTASAKKRVEKKCEHGRRRSRCKE